MSARVIKKLARLIARDTPEADGEARCLIEAEKPDAIVDDRRRGMVFALAANEAAEDGLDRKRAFAIARRIANAIEHRPGELSLAAQLGDAIVSAVEFEYEMEEDDPTGDLEYGRTHFVEISVEDYLEAIEAHEPAALRDRRRLHDLMHEALREAFDFAVFQDIDEDWRKYSDR